MPRSPTVRERLKEAEHAKAILAWAVRGCADWQERGLDPPDAVVADTEAYKAECDTFAGFLDDVLEVVLLEDLYGGKVADPQARVTSKQLRELYEEWCEEQRIKQPLGAKEIAARLEELGALPKRSGSARGWVGLRVREDSCDEVTR